MLKWVSLATVLALAAGVAAGAAIGASGDASLAAVVKEVEYIGTLWLNALRMTVIPLVFSLLVTGIASVADAAAGGRLAGRSLLVFAVLLATATVYACLVLPLAYSFWPVEGQAAQNFLAGEGAETERAVTAETLRQWLATLAPGVPADRIEPFAGWLASLRPVEQAPSAGEWIAALAPANPIAAAAETAVLPLVVFAIVFGFAATRLPAVQRDPMIAFFRAVADTMIVIVRWVLYFAPVGVFALALGVGLTSGADIVGLILQYVAIACAVTLGVSAIAYLFAFLWGGVNPARFVAASAPALAVAFSSRSSLGTLPVMVERMRDAMNIPARVANVTLPMAVAIFRMTSPVTNLAVVFFAAQVYGVELGPAQIAAGAIVAIAISVGSVGLPGEISFVASVAPISVAMGVPTDLLGILVAVEAVPDIFRTLGNVSGDMAAAVIVSKRTKTIPMEGQPAA